MKDGNYVDDQNLLYQLKAEKEKGVQGKAQFEESRKKLEERTQRTRADHQSLFQL